MRGIHNIPDIYRNSDIIYHYTSTKTALLHILPDRKLRLCPRNTSNDPIENTKLIISFSGGGDVDRTEYETITRFMKDEVKSVMDRAKQLCLCKNQKIENEEGIGYLPFEKYGFAKPRMWDQYGDKYQGVCLAFSKVALIKAVDPEIIHHDDISYINYNKFERGYQLFDFARLKSIGHEAYQKEYIDYARKRLFKKHEDYIGENEYRFCSFSEGIYDHIDISKALKGIVMTGGMGLNRKLFYAMKDELDKYKDVQFSIMRFRDSGVSGVSIEDAKDYFKLSEDIKKSFEAINKSSKKRDVGR